MINRIVVFLKSFFSTYWCILLAFFYPSMCKVFCIKTYNKLTEQQAIEHINRFRVTYLEAFLVTILILIISYFIAGMPSYIPWNKLIPTLLLAFPIYGNRNVGFLTMGMKSPSENMDKAFFKAAYIIGIGWLAWDMFKGIL